MEDKKLSDFDFHSVNPFRGQLMKEVQLSTERAVMGTKIVDFIDQDSGEIRSSELRYMGHEKVVDRTTFMKLYISNLDVFFGFSKTAQKVLKYFIAVLKRDKDDVTFDLSQCIELSGLRGKSSVYKGIAELLQKEVIAKGPNETTYFINPSVIFNGNRLVIINRYMTEDFQPSNKSHGTNESKKEISASKEQAGTNLQQTGDGATETDL
jgi:hypothetical protein